MDLKKKLEILESFEKSPFDYSKLPEYIKSAENHQIKKHVLSAVLKKLILLDTQISASYEIMSEEDWEMLHSIMDTPLPQHFSDTRKNLDILSENFAIFCEAIKTAKVEDMLQILSQIYKYKTKNVQFVIFKMAEVYPKQVFGYMLNNMRKDPKVYAPFFCSLLVRLDIDEVLKKKCINAYLKHFQTIKANDSIEFVLFGQFLLYMCCFKHEIFEEEGVKKIVDNIFKSNSASYMNRKIVDMFCELFGYKNVIFKSYRNECLYSFPFDPPVCKKVLEIVQSKYIIFNK